MSDIKKREHLTIKEWTEDLNGVIKLSLQQIELICDTPRKNLGLADFFADSYL